MKLVTISHTGRAEGEKKEDTTDQICTAMVVAESLNVANVPPVERNEDILFSNIDFDEPMYCTSRQQNTGLQHADCSSTDKTFEPEAQDQF